MNAVANAFTSWADFNRAIRLWKGYQELKSMPFNQLGPDFPLVGSTHEEAVGYCDSLRSEVASAALIEYASQFGERNPEIHGTPIDHAILKGNNFSSRPFPCHEMQEDPDGDGLCWESPQEVCGPNNERANVLGICDLAGNAWECTADTYDPEIYWKYYWQAFFGYEVQDPVNPITHPETQFQECKGGSFLRSESHLRAANRHLRNPAMPERNEVAGFRCARRLPETNIPGWNLMKRLALQTFVNELVQPLFD